MQYKAEGNKIINYDQYDSYIVAECDNPLKAIELFNKAHFLNDVKRKYTASARLFYEAEQLPNFKWLPL